MEYLKNDNDPQQNILKDLTNNKLESGHLSSEEIKNLLENYDKKAKELLPSLEKELEVQELKLKILLETFSGSISRLENLESASIGIIGSAHKNLGNSVEFFDSAEKRINNIEARYDGLSETVKNLKNKVLYLKSFLNQDKESVNKINIHHN